MLHSESLGSAILRNAQSGGGGHGMPLALAQVSLVALLADLDSDPVGRCQPKVDERPGDLGGPERSAVCLGTLTKPMVWVGDDVALCYAR